MGPPVLRFAVVVVVGSWVGLTFPVAASVAAVASFVALLMAMQGGWRYGLVCALFVGLLGGAVQRRNSADRCEAVWTAGAYAAVVRIEDAPGDRRRTRGQVVHSRERCKGSLSFTFPTGDVRGGATVVVVGSVRRPGFFHVTHYRVLETSSPFRFRIRSTVRERIRTLYGFRAPMVEALVLGQRTDIEPDVRARFVSAGLAHLLAISGLHVGILAGCFLALLRLWMRPQTAGLAALVGTWLYVALLGFPVSSVRAATFISVATLGVTRQRHPPFEATLGVALLVLVLAVPTSVHSVGAWLSVAAVWGTTVGSRFRFEVTNWKSRFLSTLGASVGATIATAPITAFAFGNVSLVGIVANLIAVPLASIAVPGLFVSLLFGGVFASGAGLMLASLDVVATVASRIPGGNIVVEAGTGAAVPWAVVLALAVWVRRWPRQPSVFAVRIAVIATTAVWGGVVAQVGDFGSPTSGLEVHMLDVGQGDAIAIRTPGNRWLLVDAGPPGAGKGTVVPFLRSHGVDRLEMAVLSHGDADHLGGMAAVFESLTPRYVLEPGQPLGTETYRDFLGGIDAIGALWQPARAGDLYVVDSVELHVLHPSPDWMERSVSVNENSLVILLRYGTFDLLLTGDVGLPAERVLGASLQRTDVLKVGHHGSSGSTSDEFVNMLNPQVALISVGRDNRYGHPTDVVLRRLASSGIEMFRTDSSGTLTIRSDGRYFEVQYGQRENRWERLWCRIRILSRLNGSSSSGSACIQRPRGNSRTFSTTLP